jgi:hypothetical protein
MDAFFDQFCEFLIEGVFAGLVGQARSRVRAEFVLLGIYPILETRVKGGYRDGKSFSRWVIRNDRVSNGGDEVGALCSTPFIYLCVYLADRLVEKRVSHGAGVKIYGSEDGTDSLLVVSFQEGFARGFDATVTQGAGRAEIRGASVIEGCEETVNPGEDFFNLRDEVDVVRGEVSERVGNVFDMW